MEKKTLTFDQAKDDLIKQVHDNEQKIPDELKTPEVPEQITPEDEYRILDGKGIEYIADGYKLYIPPLKIRQMHILKDVSKIDTDTSLSSIDKVFAYCGVLAEVLKVSKDDLLDNLEPSDINPIVDLLIYSVQHGKTMYLKKKVTAREAAQAMAAVSLGTIKRSP